MSPLLLRLHRWIGLVAGLMILIAAATAIGLNHRDWLSSGASAPSGPPSPYAKGLLSLAADPRDARWLLAGTRDGLYRSRDGGAAWEEVVLPVPAERASAIAFDAKQPGVVYVAFAEIGVYRATDGGEIWEDVALPFNPIEGATIRGLGLDGEGNLVVATAEGVYRQAAEGWRHAPAPRAAESGRTLVGWVHDLHVGRVWSTWGVPITDAVSVALIVLVLSGYILYVGRALKIRRARRLRPVLMAEPAREAARA